MKDLVVKNVDDYIATFPIEAQEAMHAVRERILTVAPMLAESLSYGMPAYKHKGKPAVYFGGYKSHIGFYATPTGHSAFADDLAGYKQGKGSVQFPLKDPMPLDLIERIVLFRIEEIDG